MTVPHREGGRHDGSRGECLTRLPLVPCERVLADSPRARLRREGGSGCFAWPSRLPSDRRPAPLDRAPLLSEQAAPVPD
jgi:hypothetical protein